MANILIIDDDIKIRLLLEEILLSAGHITHSASNGKIALSMITSQQFDLIITDILMPEFDGIELIMSLKQRIIYPEIIAMVSMYDLVDSDCLIKILGCMKVNRVLRKPFSVSQVMDTIAHIECAFNQVSVPPQLELAL